MPTTPQKDAGLRSDPPMSEPSASGTIPAASAHAAPPLDPPAERVGSTGLRVTPKTGLKVCEPGRELRHVGLADEDRPRLPDPLDQQVVVVGDGVGEDRRAVGRPPALQRVGVLHREGQAVQGAQHVAARLRLVGLRRGRPRPLDVEGHDRVELGVAGRDPGRGAARAARAPRSHRRVRRPPGPVRWRGRSGRSPARRPKIPPTTTPSTTSPAPTATPVRNSCREPAAAAGAGAVKTWPAAGSRTGAARPSLRPASARRHRRRPAPSRRCRRTPPPSASTPRSASAARRRRSSRRRPRRRRRDRRRRRRRARSGRGRSRRWCRGRRRRRASSPATRARRGRSARTTRRRCP